MSCKSVDAKNDRVSVEVLSIGEVARRESRDYTTVYRWITQGFRGVRLRATKLGKGWQIRVADLESFREHCNGGIGESNESGGPSLADDTHDTPADDRPATSDDKPVKSRSRDSRTVEQRAAAAAEKLAKMGL